MKRTLLTRAALGLALSLALGLTLTSALLPAAQAQTPAYPNRPVKIIVPFATGGPADNYARFIAQRLTESLGQAFVVDNRPGAGSVIGTDVVAKSPADGYTLLLMSNAHTVNETLIANKPFNLTRDFAGIAPINYSDLVLVAHPSVPAANLGELLRLAKASPGKINYASSGLGTPYRNRPLAVARSSRNHFPCKGLRANSEDSVSRERSAATLPPSPLRLAGSVLRSGSRK